MKKYIAGFAVLILLLAAGLIAAPSQAATTVRTCPSQSADSISEIRGIPVVYVHGWTATGAAAERETVPLLAKALGDGYQVFTFDYGWANTTWGAEEKISGCLAELIEHLSDASKAGFGAGQVAVVAHSMGGLVSRAATTYLAADGRSDALVGIVTLGTPHQGTPFYGGLATLDETISRVSPQFRGGIVPEWNKVSTPPNDSPASKCLAFPHPAPCAPVPYVQSGQKIASVAGQVNVAVTFFGLKLRDAAEIDVGDSIVPTESALGYPGSFQGSSPIGAYLGEKKVVCQLTASEINAHALQLGFFDLVTDNSYLDERSSGQAGIAMSSWATVLNFIGGPCNHGALPTSKEALADAAQFIRDMNVGDFGLERQFDGTTPDNYFAGPSDQIHFKFNYRPEWNVTAAYLNHQVQVKDERGQVLAELSFPLDFEPVPPTTIPTHLVQPPVNGRGNLQASAKVCTTCSLQVQSFALDSREIKSAGQDAQLGWEKPVLAITQLADTSTPPASVGANFGGLHKIETPLGHSIVAQWSSFRYFNTMDEAQAWLKSPDHESVARMLLSLKFD
ncbi:pimeloyl-ACP methyl ester carboxylesterase [Arthrobacter sp. GAS37]|uniref:esterase/lipase family protein n=1 Tax=Arthrobacter sp. GAS37 TaxID=3156261 RepID=UPI003833323D